MSVVERKSFVEKALSLLTEVRAGDGARVLLLGLNSFLLLLMSFYLLKTIREPLTLTQGAATVRAYSAGDQALLLLAIVPAYGYLALHVSRVITWVTLIFVIDRILFYAFGVGGAREGVMFFLWVGIFKKAAIDAFLKRAGDVLESGPS
jgi:hypothetical protein